MAKSSGNSAASIALQLQKLSNQATEKSFAYNTKEANTARAWQTEMSNTAHQREVKDLKAAGLNPVLAANNGAQSYTTSSASAQAENAANAVGNVWSSDISARATRAAAAQSAAATRYAAAQQASAARYAAALQYEAQMEGYAVKREGYDVTREGYKNKKEVAEIQNKKSLFGLLSNANVTRNIDGLKGILTKSINNSNKVIENKSNYLRNPDQGFSVKNLNFAGRSFVRSEIRRFNIKGINNQAKAFNLYTRAFLQNSRSGQRDWNNFLSSYYSSLNKSTNSAYTRSSYSMR